MKLYNSLTKEKSTFTPISEDGIVKMYSCGPTVYNHAHIGNLRAYIFMDTLRRTLELNHYKVISVMNITDVGHLTDDADNGEDKMSVSAKKENKTPQEIANYYETIFLNDLKKLNILMPTHIVKATDHIQEMQNFISKLEENGYTYKINDGIYFDVSKFEDYGKLSNINLEDSQNIARIEENKEKRNMQDFALWKFVEPNHIMKWESPWGTGCPGWHIECSAMSNKYLGERIDIHTGGVDHLQIHHENEIAQNNCALKHQVVDYWMHCEFLQVDGGKMSKSLGNGYTIDYLTEQNFSPLDYRYFALQTHYRKKLNFTFEALKASKTGLARLKALVKSNENIKCNLSPEEILKISTYYNNFVEAVNDDLNVPEGLGIMWEMLKTLPKSEDVYDICIKMDKVLGLELDKEIIKEEIEIPEEINRLAKERLIAKQSKNFALADELRNKIHELGYEIVDTKDGFEINMQK